MNYLAQRLLTFPLVLLGVSLLVFFAIRLVPGDAIIANIRTPRSDARSLCVAANTPAGMPVASAMIIESSASSSVSGNRSRMIGSTYRP